MGIRIDVIRHMIPETIKASGSTDPGIELSDRTGSCITRIGEFFFVIGFPFPVDSLERGFWHINLTSDVIALFIRNSHWDTLDGSDIGRYIFTGNAIASGNSLFKKAIFIDQRHGQTIDLVFGTEFDLSIDIRDLLSPFS